MKIISVKVPHRNLLLRKYFIALLHIETLVQQSRNLDIRRVLKYELGAVPHSITNLDDSLCKSVKSKSMVLEFSDCISNYILHRILSERVENWYFL